MGKNILLIVSIFTIQLFSYAQNSRISQYDSIMATSISNKEKCAKIEFFFKNNKEDLNTLIQMYHEFSKWNYNTNEDVNGAKKYAKKYAKKIIETYSNEKLKTDELLKKALFNLGFFNSKFSSSPNYTKALYYFDELITISESFEVRLGKTYMERGDVYDKLGDLQKTLENYEKSERIFTYNNEYFLLLKTYINITGTYATLNDSIYLKPFFKTIDKINQLERDVEISNSKKAKLYANIGTMYAASLNLKKAIKSFNKGLKLAKKENDFDTVFLILNGLSVTYKKNKEYDKAAKYLTISKRYILNDKYKKSINHNNMADLFLLKQEYENALNNYNKAITSLLIAKNNSTSFKSLPSIKDISISPYKKDILGYLVDKADGWYKYYENSLNTAYLFEAEKTIALADQIIDLLYFESNEELSKLFWRKKGAELYLRAVSVCFLLDKPEKAMYYMEKNKGMLLLENINTYKAKQFAKIPENVLEKENNSLRLIKNMQKDLLNEKLPNKKIDSIKNNLFTAKIVFEKFIDSLETAFPKYYKLKKRLTIQSLSAIKESMLPNQVIVEYLIGKETGYALLISKEKVQFQKIKNIVELNKKLHLFKENISSPFITKKAVETFQKEANDIFTAIFPFKEFITTVKGKELIIIADGGLQYIPFEALCINETAPVEDAYLIQKCAIFYKHSISLEKQINFYKKDKKNTFIGFIPTTFQDKKLPLLNHNKLEIKSISPFFKQIFTQKEATKKQFLESYNKHSIIHISTHGGIDNDIPWLAFYDQKLSLDELFVLKKEKELVVLSACKTSVGKHKKGEGLFNLTRGFINTGAKSVLSTLWNVNEKSSSEIMALFYKNISEGMRKSKALRKAKLVYIEKHKNTSEATPYYWSSFTLTGNSNAISQKTELAEVFKIGFLTLLVLLILIYIKKKFFA